MKKTLMLIALAFAATFGCKGPGKGSAYKDARIAGREPRGKFRNHTGNPVLLA